MINRGKWILIAVVCIASVLIAVIFGVSILKLNQYRASVVSVYPAPGHPQVSITSPAQSSQLSLGAPIIIQATAFNTQKILSIELYIDGELTGVESAPAGGSDYFPAEFLWSPPAPGVYSLIARANGVDQLTTTSSPVQIMVTSPDFDPNAPDTIDYALPAPPQASSPPIPDSQSNPAEQWNGTPGNWINSLTADAPPDAPELAVLLDGCSVLLSIHDLSDNEEGFEVWRLLPNSPSWTSIAVLASQSQHEWITYTDGGAHGETTYYVSAFNSKGNQDSNLVHVNVDPVDCPPPTNKRSVLTLKLESIETHIPVDKLYCYFSLDGAQWMRRPEFGFWPGGDALQEQGSFNTEIISLNLTGDDSSPEPEIKPITFYLDCWGWQADSLHYLGAISPSLDPNQPDSNQFGSEGFVAAVSQNLGDVPDQPEFFPMGGTGDDDYEFGVFEDEIQEINPWLGKSTIDPSMPIPMPYITYDPDLCKSHLPPPFQNQFGQFLFCTPYPGFDLGNEGVNPQPYFTWKMSNDCINGTGEPFCKPYIYWVSLAADLGHEVGFNIYDNNPEGFHIHHVNAPDLFSFVIPPVPCSGLRYLWVQMWYYDGSSLLPTYGPPSAKHIVECPEKIGTTTILDIQFNGILFSNLDDGESAPQDVEVYGYLRAKSESQTRYLNFAPWNEQRANCPDESFTIGGLNTGGGIDCTKTFSDGIYDLADVALSQANSYDPWQEDYKVNNNTFLLTIEEYDSLTLSVKIVDWDDGSANDLVCEGSFQIPSQSIFEWYKVKNQKFGITGPLTGSGYCQIKGIMNAVGP
ncbi:MAG: hypothetical protein KAJ55_02760 [Anaerolineales bacterium]|nr:hypothetical protein [Anaerolineales bacterium]